MESIYFTKVFLKEHNAWIAFNEFIGLSVITMEEYADEAEKVLREKIRKRFAGTIYESGTRVYFREETYLSENDARNRYART